MRLKRPSKLRTESLNEASLMNLIKFEMFTSVRKSVAYQRRSPTVANNNAKQYKYQKKILKQAFMVEKF